MGYRDYSTAKSHIVDSTGHGDFTTIQAAINAASSGQTIFIRPGTYTENPTLKAGVNLVAYDADAFTPNVTILGKCTYSGASNISLSGIRLQTNSDFCFVFSGSSAVSVYLKDCFIYASNNTAISYAVSNAASRLQIYNCFADIGTTGIGYWSSSSTGALSLINCSFNNTGGSTTASNNSAGSINSFQSAIGAPLSTSSTGLINGYASNFDTSAQNATSLTTAGNQGNTFTSCVFSSGSASTISAGTGTTVSLANCAFQSSNTNVITGAGTLAYGTVSFLGTSKGINTTTQTNSNGGTFTPAVKFGGGSTGIAYTTQTGNYSRIGSLVQFEIIIVLSNKGSSTGSMTITGMPFAAVGSPTFPLYIAVGVTAPASTTYSIAQIGGTTTTMSLLGINGATNGASAYTDTNVGSATQIFINGTYQI